MIPSSRTTLKNEIEAVVLMLGRCSFADVQREVYKRLDRLVAEKSIRMYLGELVAENKIERFIQGRYCAPGKAPPKVSVHDWIEETLRGQWPSALTPRQLQRRFIAENAYRPALEWFESELVTMERNGKVDRYAPEAYAWVKR